MYADVEHSSERYSAAERFLHRIAFFSPRLQRTLAQVETDLYARQLKTITPDRPVFVTGLPRAGTTLVLDILFETGAFATFTYRTMPFPLSPLLWQRLSKPFQKKAVTQERAHGDGMEVSVESPEAFEEAIWLNHLSDAYVRDNRLLPLGAEAVDSEFKTAFTDLIRKLIVAHTGDTISTGLRYLSKNNANISRVAAIQRLFPDASVLVCFRHPFTHCRSLAAQHERFLAMHREDAFARDYMKWIGHHDFGSNFRPIDFNRDGFGRPEKSDAAFWLRYWINAYTQFETIDPDGPVMPFCYDDLISGPDAALSAIADSIGLNADPSAAAGRIRKPGVSEPERPDAPVDLIEEALALYERLRLNSLTARRRPDPAERTRAAI
jgi:hypothetical protein